MGNKNSDFDDMDDDLDVAERYSGLIKFLRFAMIVAWGATATSGSYGFYFGTNTKLSHSKNGGKGCDPKWFPKAAWDAMAKDGDKATCETIMEQSQHGNFQITIVCISFYMVMFGIIGIMAECKAAQVFDKFAFLASRMGRGIFMIFIGSFATCMGNQIWKQLTPPPGDFKIFAVGIVDLVIGAFSCSTYLCIKSGQAGEYHAKYDDLA